MDEKIYIFDDLDEAMKHSSSLMALEPDSNVAIPIGQNFKIVENHTKKLLYAHYEYKITSDEWANPKE